MRMARVFCLVAVSWLLSAPDQHLRHVEAVPWLRSLDWGFIRPNKQAQTSEAEHEKVSDAVFSKRQDVSSTWVAEPSSAGVQFVARQALFDYATQQGLAVLKAKVQDLHIPDITKTFSPPIVGEFSLQLSNLKIQHFNVSSDEAKLVILDGFFHLWVTQVEVKLTFNWHWEKLGLSGTGDGELALTGGNIDYVFQLLADSETKRPVVGVVSANSNFESVDLKIHSFSADWLYQAVLTVFNDMIRKAVQDGIAMALQNDVPGTVNQVLSTLPTHLDIKGLPFSTTFDYSIYTLTYVLVKGYGEVSSDPSSFVAASSSSSSTTTTTTATSTSTSTSTSTTSSSKRPAFDMMPCPFEVTPLPLSGEVIALDKHMSSLYLHENMLNCISWGLYHSGLLKYSIVDGTVPKLHLTTDLLGMLIPDLPKKYPHQLLRIDAEAIATPQVSFNATTGAVVQAAYRTSIFVDNATAGVPHIATLAANLTMTGNLGWDFTIITSVKAQHTVENASLPVRAPQWDNTVAWFIQNYAGLFPMRVLVDTFVHTPVASMVSLTNAASTTYDSWFVLSNDVQVHDIPSLHKGAGSGDVLLPA